MRAAAVRICLTGRTRRRASKTLRPTPATRNAASKQRRPPDLSADRRERRALGLLDEHLPAERLDGRPGAQHLFAAEVSADSRSRLRRSQRLRHLGKSQGTMREGGGVRVRDRHASGVDRVDVSGRPETRLPDEILNDAEIQRLADESASSFPVAPPARHSRTTTSIDSRPGVGQEPRCVRRGRSRRPSPSPARRNDRWRKFPVSRTSPPPALRASCARRRRRRTHPSRDRRAGVEAPRPAP